MGFSGFRLLLTREESASLSLGTAGPTGIFPAKRPSVVGDSRHCPLTSAAALSRPSRVEPLSPDSGVARFLLEKRWRRRCAGDKDESCSGAAARQAGPSLPTELLGRASWLCRSHRQASRAWSRGRGDAVKHRRVCPHKKGTVILTDKQPALLWLMGPVR